MHRIVIILILGTLLGCELFEPRTAEPPGNQVDPYSFQQPTTPEKVLENISNAFPASKQDYYLDVLVEGLADETGFAFDPDPAVAEGHGGLFDNWGYVEEATFITNLFQRMSESGIQNFQWSDLQLETIGDQTQIQAVYAAQLSLIQSRDPLPTHLAGRAYLTLLRGEDQLYRILTWQDLSTDTLPSWSELKASLQ